MVETLKIQYEEQTKPCGNPVDIYDLLVDLQIYYHGRLDYKNTLLEYAEQPGRKADIENQIGVLKAKLEMVKSITTN